MSRFKEYDDDYEYAALNEGRWWNNVRQILAGKKGQKILKEFEQALLAMPRKQLIDGDICKQEYVFDELGLPNPVDGLYGVCAIGAYALYKGKTYEELAQIIPKGNDDYPFICQKCRGLCNICGLPRYRHNEWNLEKNKSPVSHEFKFIWCGECGGLGKVFPLDLPNIPQSETESADIETVDLGESIGMQRTLAWYIAQMNDEDFSHMTPERRWEATLKWVRQVIK